MADLGSLQFSVESASVDKATNSLDRLDMSAKKVGGSAGQVKRATDALSQSCDRASSQARQMAEAIAQQDALLRAQAAQAAAAGSAILSLSGAYATGTAQAKANAAAIMGLGRETAAVAAQARASVQAQANANSIMEAGNRTLGGTAALSRQARFGLIDLGRQFTDVGVEAAMGISPLMILIQQGPQIADAFAIIGRGGLSVGAALRTMAVEALAALAPFLPLIAGATTLAAILGGGLLLGTRAINEEHKNFAKTLGLTSDQMDRLKEKGTKLSVTLGDTLRAAFQVLGHDIAEALHLDKASKALGDFFDKLTGWAATAVENIVGAFTGAVSAILATWKLLPGAMGDLIVSGANATLRAIADMLNAAQKLLTGKEGGFSAPQLFNPLQGQAASAGVAAGRAFASGFQKGAGATHQFFTDVTAQAVQNEKTRILKDAGKARDTHTPNDLTDQLRASVDQADAQAQAAQLQALLALTTDIEARGSIQAAILQAEKAEKDAAIDKQIAAIDQAADQKHISRALADELTDRLNGVKLIQDNIANLKQQAQAQKTAVDLIHQQAGLAQDALQQQVAILGAQAGLADYSYQRDIIGRQILEAEQKIAQSKAKEAIDAAAAADDPVALAQALSDQDLLNKRQALETQAAHDSFIRAYDKVTGSLDNMSSALSQGDWVHATTSLIDAMGHLADSLGDQGMLAGLKELGQIAPMVAAVVQEGGQLASALTSAFGGNKKVSNSVGQVLGAVPGFIAGLIFNNGDAARRQQQDEAAAKQAQALQQAEISRQQTAQQQAQQQEITLAQLTGNALTVTNVQREQELAGLDASNRARQQEIYALADEIDALQKTLDTATGDVAKAQQDLQAAYSAQVQQLQSVAQAAQQASDSLGQFLGTLLTGNGLGSRTQTYGASRSALSALNARIAGGDQAALGDVQNTVSAFLSASQSYAPDALTQRRDQAFAVQSVIAAKQAADSQVSIAQQQLTALDAQVAGLMTVNQSVLTVAAAVANLEAAMNAQTSAQQALQAAKDRAAADLAAHPALTTFTNPDYVYYVEHNPDLKAQYLAKTGYARGRSESDYGLQMWTQFDNSNRQFTPYGQRFALGGVFTNGIVNQPTSFNMGLMGEAGPEAIMPLTRGPDGSLGVRAANDNGWLHVVDRLESIEQQLSGFRAEAKQGRDIVKTILDLFRRVTLGGNSIQVSQAA